MFLRFIGFYSLLIFGLFYTNDTMAQASIPPKREFRGAWIATVANIDWPSKPNLSTEQQKNELIRILDSHEETGINAIMLQIRPSTDTFYGKGEELWSRYLTGKQGKAPNPYYDPLEFAIEEAHKRGIELHAWFNPYRATMDLLDANTNADHITKKRPELFFKYGTQKLFNPGLPEVRNYIIKVIMNVVRNYDIDGVHFDDYFYPYPQSKQIIQDAEAFRLYGSEFKDIKDWRRHNVDTLIRNLSDSIHLAKKYVKFGISPFGIWRNVGQDTLGSATNGLDSYGQLYADSRKWAKEGWIDYINPQIYFPFFYRAAPYEKLVDWWSSNSFGRHLYIGHAAYRIGENREGWRSLTQMPDQIRYLRNNNRVQGSVFYSSKSITNSQGGFRDSLRTNFYQYPALQPQMIWLDEIPPLPPLELVARPSDQNINLSWNEPIKSRDGETAYGYVIYRFFQGAEINLQDPRNILKITFDKTATTFIDTTAEQGIKYIYTVTALDRLKNESLPANMAPAEINTQP